MTPKLTQKPPFGIIIVASNTQLPGQFQVRTTQPEWVCTIFLGSHAEMSCPIFPISLQIFEANKDSFTVHHNTLEKPLVTRYLRINPRTWENAICLRLEVFGCDGKIIRSKLITRNPKVFIARGVGSKTWSSGFELRASVRSVANVFRAPSSAPK